MTDRDDALWARYLDARAPLPEGPERDEMELAEALAHPERLIDDPEALEALQQTQRLLADGPLPASDLAKLRAMSWLPAGRFHVRLRMALVAAMLMLAWAMGYWSGLANAPQPVVADGSGSEVAPPPKQEPPKQEPTPEQPEETEFVMLDPGAVDVVALDAQQTASYAVLREETSERSRELHRAIAVGEDSLLRAASDPDADVEKTEQDLIELHRELIRVRTAFIKRFLASLRPEQRQRLQQWLRHRPRGALLRLIGALYLKRFDANGDGRLDLEERAAMRKDALERARKRRERRRNR